MVSSFLCSGRLFGCYSACVIFYVFLVGDEIIVYSCVIFVTTMLSDLTMLGEWFFLAQRDYRFSWKVLH